MATLAELADKLPEHEREHAHELALDVLFMRGKLEETRAGLRDQSVVIPYDNGGGQVGIRANPAFGEYQKLLRSYTATFDELRDLLESQAAKDDGKPKGKPVVNVLAGTKFGKAASG